MGRETGSRWAYIQFPDSELFRITFYINLIMAQIKINKNDQAAETQYFVS